MVSRRDSYAEKPLRGREGSWHAGMPGDLRGFFALRPGGGGGAWVQERDKQIFRLSPCANVGESRR